MRQDLYAFKAGARTYLLMIQDSLTDDGKPTPETQEVIKLLGKTLRIK